MLGLIMNLSLFAMFKSSIFIQTKHTAHYFKGLLQIYHIKEMKGANLLINYPAFYFKFPLIRKKGTDNLFIVISVIQ